MSDAEDTGKTGVLILKILLGLFLVAVAVAGAVVSLLPERHPGWVYNHSAARAAMRSYCTAQLLFHRSDFDKDGLLEYAERMPELSSARDDAGRPIELLGSMAGAYGKQGVAHNGYLFMEIRTIAGRQVDWVNDYALCAIPAEYGKTGKESFIVNANGKVFSKDQGPGGSFVKDYPADPAAAGWVINE